MAKYTAENNYGVNVEKHIWEVNQYAKLLSKIIINNKTFSNQQIFIYEKQDKYKKVDDKDWA